MMQRSTHCACGMNGVPTGVLQLNPRKCRGLPSGYPV